MVGLAGEVGRDVVVLVSGFESVVAQVAPQHGGQAQGVGFLEGGRNLLNLPVAFFGAEVHGSPHGGSPQIPGAAHRAEADLVVLGGVGQQLVVVDFDQERDFVGIAPGHGFERAEGSSHGIAAAFHC